MEAELEDVKVTTVQKPQVFFKSITFNDDTQLSLKHNSIIVFTGANNSGKSQVLKDAENCLDKSNSTSTIVIKDSEYDYCGTIDEKAFLSERFYINQQGHYQQLESGNAYQKNTLQTWWNNHTLYDNLHVLFIKRLSTEIRLTSSNALNRYSQPEKHPIYKLNKSELLAQKLSNYFH